jgi:hypothetical protein
LTGFELKRILNHGGWDILSERENMNHRGHGGVFTEDTGGEVE